MASDLAPIIGPGEGEAITAREQRDVILLADHDEISITFSRYGAGERGPDPHVHREHTDAFYVLEGELAFGLGRECERALVPAGCFVAAPPNLTHTFVNEGQTDARFLNFHSPDGDFAGFLRAMRDVGEGSFDSFDPPPDGGLPASAAVISRPGEGERLVSGNRVARLKCALPDLAFVEFEVDGPMKGPPLHLHDDEVDSFYVLEGELDVTVEDSTRSAGPGTLVSVPLGVRHRFGHSGGGTVRFLNIHGPEAGFAGFLRRISD